MEKKDSFFNRTIQLFLQKNNIYQFGLIISIIISIFISRYQYFNSIKQDLKISELALSNARLMVQSKMNSKAINQLPYPWWHQEFFPSDGKIVMQQLNDAMYYYILEPLGYDRFYYTTRTDHDIFEEQQANHFYVEKMALINDLLVSGVNFVEKKYTNEWVTPEGKKQTDGYTRWAYKQEGHIYIDGMISDAKPFERPKSEK